MMKKLKEDLEKVREVWFKTHVVNAGLTEAEKQN